MAVPQKSKFGTPEEIAARVGGAFKTDPKNAPSNFKQLGPGSAGYGPTSAPKAVSGNQKFGNPRRYA